jgi:arginase
MQPIRLISYACGWGAKDRGCKDAPARLRELGLEQHLRTAGLEAQWAELYHSPLEATTQEPLPLITDYATKLCLQVKQALDQGQFPITIGGDHSMAIGTWSGVTEALDAYGQFGLIWFDAHMDAHTPQSSPSGAFHGMPLACLLGHGDAGLCAIGGAQPKLDPRHVCLIGIRSFEQEEAAFLRQKGVTIFYMDEVKKRGLQAVLSDALIIASSAPRGYGVTIDIDAFDPEYAPGTGTREPDGLLPEEAYRLFSCFAGDDKLKAIEIAEYNHHLGHDGLTSHLIFELLGVMLKGRTKKPARA